MNTMPTRPSHLFWCPLQARGSLDGGAAAQVQGGGGALAVSMAGVEIGPRRAPAPTPETPPVPEVFDINEYYYPSSDSLIKVGYAAV